MIAAIGLAGVAIFGVRALASPPTGGFGATGVTARGTLSGDFHLNTDRIKFQIKDDVDVVAQTISIPAGGASGWHWHPGFVLVVVQQGTVTVQVGCSVNSYPAGAAFHESGNTPTQASNMGTVPVIARVTYVIPHTSPVTPTRYEVASAPNCSKH